MSHKFHSHARVYRPPLLSLAGRRRVERIGAGSGKPFVADPPLPRCISELDPETSPTADESVGWYAYKPRGHDDALGSHTTPARAVEPGVVSPLPGRGEIDVWLTGWQVEEDRRQILVGETVTADVVPMDQEWLTTLFGDRRAVAWQVDHYAGTPGCPIAGIVTRIDQVSVTWMDSTDPGQRGQVPVPGAAVVHTVSSIRPEQPHHGSIVGWIIRVLLRGTGSR